MVSEPILNLDVGVCSVWPRNPMGHNKDIVSTLGGGGGGGGGWYLLHLTSNKGESSWYYISIGLSQPRRRILKSRGPLGLEVNNIYMIGSGRYKWYQSRSSAGFIDVLFASITTSHLAM